MIESPFRKASRSGIDSPGLPPPQYVHYLPQGAIREAWASAAIPFQKPSRRDSPAKLAGLAYQKRVTAWAFESKWPGSISCSPWFCFIDDSSSRHYCQPDLLFDDGERVLGCEIKIRWTADAWWQLMRLYLPVLAKVFPSRALVPLCITRSFDPGILISEPVDLREDLYDCKPSSLNVVLVR